MITKKLISKPATIVVLLAMVLVLPLAARAEGVVPSFVGYQNAQANVSWRYLTNEGEEFSEGVFRVSLPDFLGLTLSESDDTTKRINGYQDIVAIHTPGAQPQYQYETIQLFKIYQLLFGELVNVAKQPHTYLGDESVGGRNVSRYQSDSFIFWFDRETNIPVRISDNAGNNRLSLRQYQVDAHDKSGVESYTLMSHNTDWEGIIRLGRFDGQWFPTELQVGDGHSQIIIKFKDWQILNSNLEFSDLKKLATYKNQAEQAFTEQNYSLVADQLLRALAIDPYYLPAYAQLAFSYTQLDNYLGVVESYQQWLMLEPQNSLALNNLAYTYMLANSHLDRAIELAYQAVMLEPKPTYLDTLGYGYYLVKDYDKAIHYLLQAKANMVDEKQAEPISHLILVYQALGIDEQVEYYMQKLTQLITERSYD